MPLPKFDIMRLIREAHQTVFPGATLTDNQVREIVAEAFRETSMGCQACRVTGDYLQCRVCYMPQITAAKLRSGL